MIINFGSLNMDYVYRVPRFVKPGETLKSDGLSVNCGGKGLNQSVAMAKSGGTVEHVGLVGEADGDVLVEALAEAGVRTGMVRKSGARSGHAVIQVDDSGQNCIIVYPGANRRFTAEMVEEAISARGEGDAVAITNEVNCVGAVMRKAYERGLKIAFNPSPFDIEILNLPLETVSYLFVNETEACGITGGKYPWKETLLRLSAKFPKCLHVLTLGDMGAAACQDGKIFKKEAHVIDAVDTTAAGDAFLGYFLSYADRGRDLDDCLDMANMAAAMCVSRPGAAISIPGEAEVLSNAANAALRR